MFKWWESSHKRLIVQFKLVITFKMIWPGGMLIRSGQNQYERKWETLHWEWSSGFDILWRINLSSLSHCKRNWITVQQRQGQSEAFRRRLFPVAKGQTRCLSYFSQTRCLSFYFSHAYLPPPHPPLPTYPPPLHNPPNPHSPSVPASHTISFLHPLTFIPRTFFLSSSKNQTLIQIYSLPLP